MLVWQSHGGARDNGVTNLGKIMYGFLQTWVYAVIDSGDRTFLQRGSPTPTSLASVARITFFSSNPPPKIPLGVFDGLAVYSHPS